MQSYDVAFDSMGGSAVSMFINIPAGSIISKPRDPVYEGYTFIGWYKDSGLSQAWNWNYDTVTMNTRLYAKWELNFIDKPAMEEEVSLVLEKLDQIKGYLAEEDDDEISVPDTASASLIVPTSFGIAPVSFIAAVANTEFDIEHFVRTTPLAAAAFLYPNPISRLRGSMTAVVAINEVILEEKGIMGLRTAVAIEESIKDKVFARIEEILGRSLTSSDGDKAIKALVNQADKMILAGILGDAIYSKIYTPVIKSGYYDLFTQQIVYTSSGGFYTYYKLYLDEYEDACALTIVRPGQIAVDVPSGNNTLIGGGNIQHWDNITGTFISSSEDSSGLIITATEVGFGIFGIRIFIDTREYVETFTACDDCSKYGAVGINYCRLYHIYEGDDPRYAIILNPNYDPILIKNLRDLTELYVMDLTTNGKGN